MKTRSTEFSRLKKSWLSAIFLAAIFATSLSGEEPARKAKHPAFEKLKSLQGKWSGPATWDQGGKKGDVQFEVVYKTTAGGKAVMETMFAGTPGEMVTMYYLEGDDLVLVHYCTAGNQPKMKLESAADADELSFRCLGGTNMTEEDSHMHWVRLAFVDADHLSGGWNSMKAGRVEWTATAELIRQK